MKQPLPSLKRALLLINRQSRQGQQRLSRALDCLKAEGFDAIAEPTDEPQQLSEIIRRYRDQVDLVIIGGGDGTLNAAAQGLVDTQLPLGILPLGTANDLARTLKIPNSVPDACRVIATGRLHRIDLGWVNGTYFFNVASCGLSVKITQQLTKEAKRRWGVLAYAATALRVTWQSRPFRAEIRCNGESFQVKTIQLAIGNGRHYGGGMTVAHDATIDDRRLDLYSLEMRHWWQIIMLLPALRQGRHTDWSGVRTLHGTEIEINTRKPRDINTDGEITTQTPAKFRVVPQVLSVLVPR
ncbi:MULTISPECIES: lipid kinase [unclassified Coleofasciculus]|uniref:lipid kinase n=1 Tax=unclassified Coleofasciculus TaxID=2692782 RepID=UPI0018814F67|nr:MULTISPECIES: lipid kinase [unclassified Coleofasciculus]MBE9129489.1 lipid kinase [Coleofasciculus sp. LEGE 07081]MBE9148275.1 lipid kinase [Coleofasciculus sp. LEGE 07092]